MSLISTNLIVLTETMAGIEHQGSNVPLLPPKPHLTSVAWSALHQKAV